MQIAASLTAAWGEGSPLDEGLTGAYSTALPLDLDIAAPWAAAVPLDVASRGTWGIATQVDLDAVISWGEYGPVLADASRGTWGIATPADVDAVIPWGEFGPVLAVSSRGSWGIATPADVDAVIPWGEFGPVLAVSSRGSWGIATPAGRVWIIPWGPYAHTAGVIVIVPTEEGDPTEALITIPLLRSYLMIHDIAVYRLPDMTPIHASRVSLSLDADSWCWGFSATLLGRDALDAMMPDIDGAPVTLEVAIDGHYWHVLVEDWSEDRLHAQRGISVSGRGLTAWLGAPYELPGNGVTTAALTLQQLVESHLPIGSGWTVNWSAPDWLIPSGAWTWQGKSPIQAMQEIVQGVGLILVPAGDTQEITVRPRYPVLPWDYATTAPDLQIPDSAIIQVGRRQAVTSQANAVYVHGGEVGGVLARVKRTGSAGDRVAPTVNHPLITHADAARSLGSRLLAGQQQQPETRRITIGLGGAYPLAILGDLVRIDYASPSATDRGIVNGIAIEAARGDKTTVRQSLTLGEDTPNQWAKFRALLPGDPLLAGTILTDHADGTVTVAMIGGGSMRVRGTGTVDQSVWVRGGRIEGDAPALSAVEIEV